MISMWSVFYTYTDTCHVLLQNSLRNCQPNFHAKEESASKTMLSLHAKSKTYIYFYIMVVITNK